MSDEKKTETQTPQKPVLEPDHKFEPGAYGVCRRCGKEKH